MATERKSTSSSAPRKSAPAKKATKKASAAKASSDKAAPRKSSASRSRDDAPRAQASASSESSGSSNGTARSGGKKLSAMKVARAAAQQLSELTGRAPETVTGIQRSDDGWVVELEVVESRRIPDSTDILATYRVEVDEDGELMAYHRAQRYVRGKGGSGDGGGR